MSAREWLELVSTGGMGGVRLCAREEIKKERKKKNKELNCERRRRQKEGGRQRSETHTFGPLVEPTACWQVH